MMNYDNILNPITVSLKPSGIRKYFDIASTMDDVVSLGVGEPDFYRGTSDRREFPLSRRDIQDIRPTPDLPSCAKKLPLITTEDSE